MKICYIDKKFSTQSLYIIETANYIIGEYASQGYTLTLRQLYYQFVARDLIPNTQNEYKRLGSIINDARLAGWIDWESITDRTRNLMESPHWNAPADILDTAVENYAIDKWEGQKYRPEVWIEKDALLGVIEGVCTRYSVPYFSCRGYVSQSEMWRAAQRQINHDKNGQCPVIIYLGDHDPSGIDMTRDVSDRIKLMAGWGDDVPVARLALSRGQIQTYKPPPNPTKITDSRANGYISKYGYESWELDALEPSVMVELIEEVILGLRDEKEWKKAIKKENKGRKQLQKMREKIS